MVMMLSHYKDGDKPYLRRWGAYDYRRFLLWYLWMQAYYRRYQTPTLPAGSC